MKVTLVFDTSDEQPIEKKHVLKLNFMDLKKAITNRGVLWGRNKMECAGCDVVISRDANAVIKPFISVQEGIEKTTVFDNITHNTISQIEILNGEGQTIVYVPSVISEGANKSQSFHQDNENNLHISCRNHPIIE